MDAIIVGAGGFGKEIAFLLQQQNEYQWVGFVDDRKSEQSDVLGKPVIGKIADLLQVKTPMAVFLGIAAPTVKEKIYEQLRQNPHLLFPNLFAPSALIGLNVQLGIGNILMPYTTYTADISIGDFNMINIGSTIGHDSIIGSYNAIFPNVNISGAVTLGDKNELGVGTKIIQERSIGDGNIIGAGSVVNRDIPHHSKWVGVPAKIIERWS
ncbi:acetyltransferase [Enterococcus hirae]|uniref:acetyltransferase n=1 Tax=Enterococcus hirae TaxID=1354 RepID=UPI00221EC889|nr:acetyltransferase [Enterococcus hirae]MDT2664234.1 acetyltransferase [Enterococcus hirae]MDW3665199.1 acetyltransferase [Enterococcus hirae]UYT93670.1 acetyltransferase [Enterococcus hirae]